MQLSEIIQRVSLSFIQYSLVVALGKIILWYYDQVIDMATIHWSYSNFLYWYSFVCMPVCLLSSIQFYHLTRLIYLLPESKYWIFQHHKDAPLNHIHLLPALPHPQPQVPYPDIYLSPISKILSFFEMLCKWNHPLCNLWGLAFFS